MIRMMIKVRIGIEKGLGPTDSLLSAGIRFN